MGTLAICETCLWLCDFGQVIFSSGLLFTTFQKGKRNWMIAKNPFLFLFRNIQIFYGFIIKTSMVSFNNTHWALLSGLEFWNYGPSLWFRGSTDPHRNSHGFPHLHSYTDHLHLQPPDLTLSSLGLSSRIILFPPKRPSQTHQKGKNKIPGPSPWTGTWRWKQREQNSL